MTVKLTTQPGESSSTNQSVGMTNSAPSICSINSNGDIFFSCIEVLDSLLCLLLMFRDSILLLRNESIYMLYRTVLSRAIVFQSFAIAYSDPGPHLGLNGHGLFFY
jgi:hypothetical protein